MDHGPWTMDHAGGCHMTVALRRSREVNLAHFNYLFNIDDFTSLKIPDL